MAIDRSEGFIYTLEAIIAATMMLTTVTLLMPEDAGVANTESVQDSMYASLQALDKTGELRDNLSVEALESDFSGYVPPGYNHSVRVTELKTENRRFSSPAEFHFDKTGESAELQLWLETAGNLDITFDGETVLEGRDSTGYLHRSLNGTSGWLNFTGTGSGELDFDVYDKRGGLPDRETALAVSYMVADENLTEIRMFLWSR